MKYSESLGELKYLRSGMKNEKRNACSKKAFNVEVLPSPSDHIVNKFKFILVVGKKSLDICQFEFGKKIEILNFKNLNKNFNRYYIV